MGMCTCAVPAPSVLSRPFLEEINHNSKDLLFRYQSEDFRPATYGIGVLLCRYADELRKTKTASLSFFLPFYSPTPPSQTYSPLPLCCLRRVTRRWVSSCASLGATESRRSRRPPALGTHAHELGAGGGCCTRNRALPAGGLPSPVFPLLCVVVVVVGCCYCCYCLLLLCSGGTASPCGPERTSQPSPVSQAGPLSSWC